MIFTEYIIAYTATDIQYTAEIFLLTNGGKPVENVLTI